MFSKKNRIKTDKINKLLSQKKFISNDYYIFKISEKTTNNKANFAVIVSKKVEKSAVKRHLIKRRILNSLKEISLEKKFQNKDFLIIVRPQVSKIEKGFDFTELKKYLIEIINKNKFLFLENL